MRYILLSADSEVTAHTFSLDDNSGWTPLAHIAQKTFLGGPLDAGEVILHNDGQRSSRLKVRTQRTPAIGGASLCVMFLQDQREMEARLRELASPGDLIITVGAGNIFKVGEAIVEKADA